ncbi:SufS family cysteine desulfurase [Candidatus Woesearchaeota archaeon]|nr:SufS family cysteine desulfurase [Candidatus Woesearchaeota archaeon]
MTADNDKLPRKKGKIDDPVADDLKKDFPQLARKINRKRIVYLDNAATTQKPSCVIEAVKRFYEEHNANVHRGLYSISEESTRAFDEARAIVARFLSAEPDEIIFTKGATEGLNLLSWTVKEIVGKGREKILLTELEHHSNLVPWQELAKREGFKLEFVRIKKDFMLDMDDLKKKLDKKTAIFSFTAVSNAVGTKTDIALLSRLGREVGAITIIDAAQAAPHMKLDVKEIGCDFLTFSGHKMLGPAGVGVLYGKKDLLGKLPPFQFGGHMIRDVDYESATYGDSPEKFEAGTPNMEGVIGLGEAVRYLEAVGLENISSWENSLLRYALKKVCELEEVEVYTSGAENSAGVLSFNMKGVHPHDISSIFNDYNVCVRAGHHCTMPLMKKMGVSGTVRVSFYFYNTIEDVDLFVEALKKAISVFHPGAEEKPLLGGAVVVQEAEADKEAEEESKGDF